MTLTPFDDYPIHQTPLPLSQRMDGHPNHYDRYWFNGYDPDGAVYFGIAMGLYPNRRVIDAAFSVVQDGVQRSVFASGPAPDDPTVTRIGPISIEILEPLGRNRVRVNSDDLPVDITWNPRTPAIAEPRQTLYDGSTVMLDSTRLTQWGSWTGTVGDIAVDASSRGTKDRSWGVRPVGDQPNAAPSGRPPGIFFLWSPVHFADSVAHAIVFEDPHGGRLYQSALRMPVDGEPEHGVALDHRIEWRPGTRRSKRTTITTRYPDGSSEELVLEPILDFQMKGLGYLHPTWGHGRWHGGEVTGAEEWKLADLDPLALEHIHVQQLCRVRRGDEEGVGILEQLAMGPHEPTGLKDYFDGG